VYKTEETLWRDNIAQNQQAWAAFNNLGLAIRQCGRVPEAVEQYEHALRIKPDYADAHNNLGVALVQIRRVPEAIGHYEQALQIKPDYPGAHNNLGVALLLLGRATDAARHFERALTLQPDYAEAHYNLGLAKANQNLLAEAIEHWKQAVLFKPDYPEAYYNLGLASEQTRNGRDAIGYYEQALRFRPNYLEAQNNLAWLLATLTPANGGDPARSMTLASRTCELTGSQVAMYVDTLAIACAAAGRFDDAVQAAQKAIGLAEAAGQQQLARDIGTRLELYRNGHPYRPWADGTGSSNP
jgi:tetratricopeptide (TPR) repeat protein